MRNRILGQNKPRTSKGNMIVLIAAVTMGLVIALIFFCLNYSRLLGSNAEQKKAIEASALAAANDISNIVINTKEFGYVSLSDQAPIGTFTKAGDQYFMPVRGINTIIGTARLDAIIADLMPNSTIMKTLAANDMTSAQSALAQLTAVVQASLTPAGSPKAVDRDGNPLTPYADAQNAYLQNCVRMTGSSSFVPGSLKLTLGSLSNPTETNIRVPQPQALAPVAGNLQQNNNYKSFVNIPYKGVNYVFGGIGSAPRLVDVRDFVTTVPGLPYQIPTIVKAECDQIIKTSQTPNGATFHSAACGQPASIFDVRPAPGALAIEFPDGPVPDIKTAGDLLTAGGMNASADILTSPGGDYPVSSPALSAMPNPWPPNVGSQSMGDGWRVAMFDWIRRAGSQANIADVLAMQTRALGNLGMIDWVGELSNTPPLTDITSTFGGPQIPMGVMHLFKFDTNGNVASNMVPCAPYPFEVVSENQLYGEVVSIKNGAFNSTAPQIKFSGITLPSGIKGQRGRKSGVITGLVIFTPYFDMYLRDQCRVPGIQAGGKHGGEPLNDAIVAAYDPAREPSQYIATGLATGIGAAKDYGGGSGTMADYGAGGSGAGGGHGGCGGPCNQCCCGCCTQCMPPPPPPTGAGGPGSGSPPLLAAESDFGDPVLKKIFPPPYVQYSTGPGGGAMRPTYQTTALAASIRFRRQIQVSGSLYHFFIPILGGGKKGNASDIGYLSGKSHPVTYGMVDKTSGKDVDVTDDFGDK